MQIHLIQFASSESEPLRTLERLKVWLKDFKPKANDWMIFPEMWPSSFNPKELKKQEIENAFCFHWLKNYSRLHKCYMTGSMLELPLRRTKQYSQQAYNSTYLIDPKGELINRYRKIHLFTLGQEHEKFIPGRHVRTVTFPWGKIGLAICFDLRFPELFRMHAKRGAQVVMIPSAWPKVRIDHWLTLLKARAIENQCFMIGVNKVGKDLHGLPLGGHSAIFGPWGECHGLLKSRPGILSVKLDLQEVKKVRKQYPFLKSRVFL